MDVSDSNSGIEILTKIIYMHSLASDTSVIRKIICAAERLDSHLCGN